MTMDDAKPQAHPPPAANPPLAVFVHGRHGTRPDAGRLAALVDTGVRVFSHWPGEGSQTLPAGLDEFGAVCREVGAHAPGQPLLVLSQALTPSPVTLASLTELANEARGPGAFTAFSNLDPELNPYAGLDATHLDGSTRERLVALLGSGRLFEVDRPSDSLLLLTPKLVASLAESPVLRWEDLPEALGDRGVRIQVPDWIWAEASGRDPGTEPVLDPHETRRPRAWGALSLRLQDWLQKTRKDAAPLELPLLGTQPVTLHITHSWGGGVATWVRSMIDSDPTGLHLQLRSEGPQSGQGAGQRLSLYLGNRNLPPLASWWLQPPIRAVDRSHAQYDAIIADVCARFGVGRVIVSSLVGHGLGALDTGRPTVQVLHDAFPAWPLLNLHPEAFDYELTAAFEDPRAKDLFPEISRSAWRSVIEGYAAAARQVLRVAPSRAARAVQARVEPGFEPDSVRLIPHGLPPMPLGRPQPRPRQDGRLRIVVPGRVQSGKGAELLEAALPALLDIAHITLLGTGKGGERFFGRGGVNVIIDYDRQSLATLLATIGPQLALLPSTVPETFSYTLSEMHALGLPVLATAVGSFVERIEAGENGWCVAPEPEALVAKVRALAADPDAIEAVRRKLAAHEPRSMAEMVADYDALCPPGPPANRPFTGQAKASLTPAEAQAASLADLLRRARSREAQSLKDIESLQTQLSERTRWAEDEKRQRQRWVASLRDELAEARLERDGILERSEAQEAELHERAAHIERLDKEIAGLRRDNAELRQAREALQIQLDQVLASHSWKLTAPLRVSRRLLANFFLLKAWNPLRWPLLLSQTVRNLSTVGLAGTLRRMQHFGTDTPAPNSSAPAEPVQLPASISLPVSLPVSESPRVSIVIPVYNHLDHTAACLVSLVDTRCDVAFEVIVVDDASSDDTAGRLPGITGLRYFRNAENLGFIGSCNHGAEQARGEYVLFLNNDTQVTDGWLEALLDTFEQQREAGLVGARLVYPDGTLQECGGMVFSDGSGWNYGRGDDPDRPEYQALREVDYCSGACIMLPRALFNRLCGFDRHYAPAYYEDTDLAFKVREAGLKVFVQPRATIVHFEGVTSGTDIASGTKRYQAINREKFLARWKDALKRQPAPISDPQDAGAVRAARDHRLKGRVLVVDAYTPEPDQDSGSVRLVNLMRCFQDLGYGVTFFADNRAWNGRYTRDLQKLGIEAWYDPWLKSPERFLEARGQDFDLAIVSRHYVAVNYLGAVRRFAPQARFVFDTVDLHYLREQRLAELENSTTLRQVAKQTRRSELGVIRESDATLVVSPVEQALLAEEVPDAGVFVLSNIHEVGGRSKPFSERRDLYFVGGYQHPPNIDAAEWFVTDIWPRVRERLPGVTFHLVGSKATDAVRALGEAEGVKFHGFVESLAPFLDDCRIAVAPLRYGAGVKGKVNQAMAHGQPVVATPAAVEGLGAADGEDVLVADDAEGFADAVVRLYGDESLWNRLSAGGIANVEQHFSAAAARRDLRALLAGLNSPKNARS